MVDRPSRRGSLAQLAIARRPLRAENDALAFQHPGIAPPQRLGLAPGAVEQHDAFDIAEDGALVRLDLALAVDRDDLARRYRDRRPWPSRDRAPPSARDRRPAGPAPWRGSARTGRSSRTAFLKCSAVSRAVPSALSCSCGCCRISSEILFSIGVTLSQMHSGSGLRQCGQSGTASAAAPASDSACSDMRPLYASRASRQQFNRAIPRALRPRRRPRIAAAAGRSGDRSPASCTASGSATRTTRR